MNESFFLGVIVGGFFASVGYLVCLQKATIDMANIIDDIITKRYER